MVQVLSDNTYMIRCVPFDQDAIEGPGVPYKETAVTMEKLPSQLLVHRHPTGMDSNWANYRHAFVPAPLQQVLSATNYGKSKETGSRINR